MRRNIRYILLLGAMMCAMACSKEDIGQMPADESLGSIYLSAGLGDMPQSRIPYAPEGGVNTPTNNTPLNASVWASTTSGQFPNSGQNGKDGTVAIHTKAHFTSGEPQLLGEAIYPKNPGVGGTPEKVYFVGLHPQSTTGSAWEATDGNRKAQFTFTGKEDVMFASQIEGVYGTPAANSPQFTFYHLLTLLTIEMVADKDEPDVTKRDEVAEAWGNIQSLTIKSKNKVEINLDYINSDWSTTRSNLEFGYATPVDMQLYQTGTDDVFPQSGGFAIPNTITEVAYVMCEPVQAAYQHTVDGKDVLKPEYTLHIVTDKRELDIPIDLKVDNGTEETAYYTQHTMGKHFKLLLNFKMGNTISVSASIGLTAASDWYTHGSGTSDLDEDDLQ